MSITTAKKQEIIKKHAQGKNDTGSVEVQVAILTARIQSLTEHMKSNKKDFGTRRGLLRMVSKRRNLLDYLKGKNQARYEALIKELELRR